MIIQIPYVFLVTLNISAQGLDLIGAIKFRAIRSVMTSDPTSSTAPTIETSNGWAQSLSKMTFSDNETVNNLAWLAIYVGGAYGGVLAIYHVYADNKWKVYTLC